MIMFFTDRRTLLLTALVLLLIGMYTGPIALVAIPLIALLLLFRGFYTELLLCFFFTLVLSDSRNPVLDFAGDVKNIYILILGVGLLFIPRNNTPFERTLLVYIPFLLIALFCLVFRETLFTGLQKTLSYLLLIMVVPNYIHLAWRKEGTEFVRALVWWGTTLLLAGFVLRVLAPEQVILSERYTGILGNPNGLGLFSMLFFILVRIIETNWTGLFGRWERVLIYGLLIGSIWLCGSRNSLFAVILFVVFGYFYRLSPLLGFLLFSATALAYGYISANLVSIVLALGLEDQFRLDTFESASGRLIAWEFGWEFIQQSITFGKGLGYTDELYKKYYAFLSIKGHQGNAHNSYITFWLDTGVFGLLFFLRGILVSFWRSAQQNRYAMPALYAILFTAFFESWMTASLNPFTIQLFMIITLLNVSSLPEPMNELEVEVETSADAGLAKFTTGNA